MRWICFLVCAAAFGQTQLQQNYDARAYNFTAQRPGSALSAGSNTITLAPVPKGVNGTDTHHALYISGTGTPEGCLITGGTAVSGATSGTIVMTCANAHAAGYTVSSFTSGIKEAIVAGGAGATIFVAPGTYAACDIGVDLGNVNIHGSGREATILHCETTNLPVFHIYAVQWVTVRNMSITRTATPVSGGYGIQTEATSNLWFEDLLISNHYDGMFLKPTTYNHIRKVDVQYSVQDGFHFVPNNIDVTQQWQITESGASGNGRHGFFIDNSAGTVTMIAPEMKHIIAFANQGSGIRAQGNTNATRGVYAFLLDDYGGEANNASDIYMDTYGNSHMFNNINVGGAGLNNLTVGYPHFVTTPSNAAYGLEVTANNDTTQCPSGGGVSSTGWLTISGFKTVGNAFSGAIIGACGVSITGIMASYNGAAHDAAASKRSGIVIQASNTVLGGAQIYTSAGDGFGNIQQEYGINISGSSAIGTVSLGQQACDTPNSMAACIRMDTVPTSYSAGIAGSVSQSFGGTGATAGAVGATVDTTLTLSEPFPDTSYTATCTLTGAFTGVPTIVGVKSRTGSTAVLTTAALTASAASAAGVDCVFRHK